MRSPLNQLVELLGLGQRLAALRLVEPFVYLHLGELDELVVVFLLRHFASQDF